MIIRNSKLFSIPVLLAGARIALTCTSTDDFESSKYLIIQDVDEGTLLASQAMELTEGDLTITLDLLTTPITTLFSGELVDYRVKVKLTILDVATRSITASGFSYIENSPLISDEVSVDPSVQPDVYLLNESTGLYHKLTVTTNELGQVVTSISATGVEL